MKRFAAPVITLILSLGVVVGASAQINNIPPSDPNCAPLGHTHLNGQRYPTNIEPEFPIWCYPQPGAIPATRTSGANDWVDTFVNDAPSILQFNDRDMGYRVFQVTYGPNGAFKMGSFVNVNHWMIDFVDTTQYNLFGGVLVSPNRQFQFENGKLVVEVDAAAGSDGMGGANAFYEIDVTPAPEPTFGVDTAYGYGSFGGVGALGCRLERNGGGGNFVCTMYDNSGRATDGRPADGKPCPPDAQVSSGSFGCRSGRVWETQGVGTARTAASVTGGYPDWPIPGTNMHLRDAWRQCADNELDVHCRDRFRMEITKDSIHMFVNGFPAMQIDGLYSVNPDTGVDNRIPDAWFQQGVRPYFTSWINLGQHTPTRWHWDRIAVNPHDANGNVLPPSAAPSFCLGQPNNTCPDGSPGGSQPNPGGTSANVPATPVPTSAPVATAVPTNASQPGSSPPSGGGGGSGGSGASRGGSAASVPVVAGGGVFALASGPSLAAPQRIQAFAPVVNAPAPALAPVAAAPVTTNLTSFHAEFAAEGGQLVANNLVLTVPDIAIGSGGADLTIEPNAQPTVEAPEGGFALGGRTYRLRLVDRDSGLEVHQPAAPLSLTYQPTPAELAVAGWQLNRVQIAAWNGSGWVALSCTSDGNAVTLSCSVPQLDLLGVLMAPEASSPLDVDLPNGHFFKQANGYSGAGVGGFAVIDDADAGFWGEFQRLGGVDQLGYPISGRFQFGGFVTQVFQKFALQWRPELGAAIPFNTFDELRQPGIVSWLETNRQVPPTPVDQADVGLAWDDVVSRHVALLDSYPALREFYDRVPDSLDRYGLPVAVADYGTSVNVRLQRATFQMWAFDTPWAPAGTVVLGNAGDLAKEVGLWPTDALIPRPFSAFAQLTARPE